MVILRDIGTLPVVQIDWKHRKWERQSDNVCRQMYLQWQRLQTRDYSYTHVAETLANMRNPHPVNAAT